jgi:SET domain-containing protein
MAPQNHIEIKKSNLPGAGKGLFARNFIPKRTLITEYKGRIRTWAEVKQDKASNVYLYYVNRNHVIDARNYKKSKARYANDARGLQRIKGFFNNAVYIEKDGRVFIESARDIAPGEEILVSYGKEYWDAIRYNEKISVKKNN